MRVILILGFLCLNALIIQAQDIHFSQYMASPLSLNPAETGRFEGNWRFTNNYRNQWSTVGIPFKTLSLGFDKPFRTKKGAVALGVYYVNDKSGGALLTENKVLLSCTWHIQLSERSNLGIGVQGGYVVKGFSINNLTFPSQFNSNSGVFDQDLPNNIDQWDESINYPDINLGLVYSGEMGVTEPVLGLSVFHLNNPKKSFLREDDKLAPRVAAYGALQFYLPGSVYFKPHVLSMFQKGAKDILVGLEGGYFFPDKSVLEKLYAGIETRTAFNSFDAVSPVLGIGLYNFELAVSYDVNVSQFRNVSNMRGAIEFTLIYKDFAKVLETITLPCDRY